MKQLRPHGRGHLCDRVLARAQNGLVGTCLRLATVCGSSPRMRFDLTVNEFTRELALERELLMYGEQFWRPNVHLRDAAQAIALALDASPDLGQGQVFNVGHTDENAPSSPRVTGRPWTGRTGSRCRSRAREEEGTSSAHHLAVVLLPEGADRDAVRAALAEQRIQTSVHYPPIHGFSQYRELGTGRPLPRTEAVAGRLLTLPLYAHMSDEQVDAVVEALLDAI